MKSLLARLERLERLHGTRNGQRFEIKAEWLLELARNRFGRRALTPDAEGRYWIDLSPGWGAAHEERP